MSGMLKKYHNEAANPQRMLELSSIQLKKNKDFVRLKATKQHFHGMPSSYLIQRNSMSHAS